MVNTKARQMTKKYHPYSKEDIKKFKNYFIIEPNTNNNSNNSNTNNNSNNSNTNNNSNNSNTINRYENVSEEWMKENGTGLTNN
jgi:hypothetical protein